MPLGQTDITLATSPSQGVAAVPIIDEQGRKGWRIPQALVPGQTPSVPSADLAAFTAEHLGVPYSVSGVADHLDATAAAVARGEIDPDLAEAARLREEEQIAREIAEDSERWDGLG